MHSRTVEQVQTWDARPFSGGLGTLYELSESDHTGAVVAEDTWLFMLNGRVIGIFEGTMDDFESSGTIYTTQHDSLPLLFAMQERDGRTRAKYFTEDTSLEAAGKTLADANFTGYVELSENVLSGDYYLVYYGGTRRSVAFVGQSERVETGDAAFERATEEVGLYEVKDVSMTITEIPEPREEPTGAGVAEIDTGGVEDGERTDQSVAEASPESEPAVASTSGGGETEGTSEPEVTESISPDSAGTHSNGDDSPASSTAELDSVPASTGDTEEEPGVTDSRHESGETGSTEETREREKDTETPESTKQREPPETAGADDSVGSQRGGAEGDGSQPTEPDSDLERMFRAEAQWRRSNAIPALDPDETESTGDPVETGAAAGPRSPERSQTRTGSGTETTTESTGAPERESRTSPSTAGTRSTADRRMTAADRDSRETPSTPRERVKAELERRDSRIDDLENRLEEIQQEREDLEGALEDERAERSRLESELSEIRAERDELASRVEELEATSEGPGSGTGGTELSPAEALAGTNLFVRYDSKSDPTLEALDSEVDADAVNANLSLEHHTEFETEDVRVDGRPYREFLEATGEFRFVSWVLRELPYELIETGNRNALGDLFEAISAIDRIEFDGSVTVDPEAGAFRRFALVMRDRMGNPLILGAYNDDRNPVRDEELETLLDGTLEVAAAVDSLAGAFYVTASFFEPAALERAENAASSGGLFSRQERASFVSPDSGTGFHLGLIEDRSQAFHVTVPKL